MDKIEDAIQTVHKLDHKSNSLLCRIHPLVKLVITITYLILLTSISKYDLVTTLAMSIYLILMSIIQDISIKEIVKRFKIIFLLLIFVGIANPILDRNVVMYIGNLPITTGLISMVTLILKGFFAVISSFILISTTGIEEICYALKLLHIPNILVIIIMLIYRYVILFLKEVQRIWIAYQMRAPNQKGVNFRVWGSMIGTLMIRSIDKANNVYESMELRGFNPENFFVKDVKFDINSIIYLILCLATIIIIRYIPIFELIGNIFI